MKIKTSELTGAALDYAVAITNGISPDDICVTRERLYRWHRNADGEKTGSYLCGPDLLFSTKWESGGPIIEREWLCADRLMDGRWCAAKRTDAGDSMLHMQVGPTPLIAAMRCYVASKLGDEVDIPEKLCR
jgi:hypothetical protein